MKPTSAAQKGVTFRVGKSGLGLVYVYATGKWRTRVGLRIFNPQSDNIQREYSWEWQEE